MIPGTGEVWEPKINTRRHGTDMVIQVDLPGVDSSSIDIEVLERVLTITGVRVAVVDEDEWLTRESAYGSFRRSVELPVSFDSTAVRAELREGVLLLTVRDVFGTSETRPAHVRIATPAQSELPAGGRKDFYDACP